MGDERSDYYKVYALNSINSFIQFLALFLMEPCV